MLAKKYRSTVCNLEKHQEGVYTISFETEKHFDFEPGQFLHLAIDQDYDGVGQWPESRCFSMQSNPSEKLIKITYSVKGAFTKEMEAILKVGTEVWIKLPYGDLFTQEHSKQNTVFIAGGTGVTPFLSLFTHDSFSNYSNPRIYLGFRDESLHLYKEELIVCKKINPSAQIIIFYQDKDGVIDCNRILQESDRATSYFISGPPAMISAFKNLLHEGGIALDSIKTDDWE